MHCFLALNANPRLSLLIDKQTGGEIAVRGLLTCSRDEVLELLARLQRSRTSDAPQDGKLLCVQCYCPVYLCGQKDKTAFYFKHFVEDDSCPAMAGRNLSEAQINALRYHGQRESARHIRLKNIIADSVRVDSAFSEPIVEGSWRGRSNKDLRRPDVRTRFEGRLDIALEVQLSTTFARIMAEREIFYRNEGAILLWVFGSFSLEEVRLLMEVIFVHNNRNAFIVSEETLAASQAAGEFLLDVIWTEPCIEQNAIAWNERQARVRFADLTIDTELQRTYYCDVDAKRAELERQIEYGRVAGAVQEFWFAYHRIAGRERPSATQLETQWRGIRREASKTGVALPHFYDPGVQDVSRILLSAKTNASVGWDFANLWGAAHHVFAAHDRWLWIFLPALEAYGRLSAIEAQDARGNWRKKFTQWHHPEKWPRPEADHSLDGYIIAAFPELAAHVQ